MNQFKLGDYSDNSGFDIKKIRNRRNDRLHKIVYPYFNVCAEICEDIFWKDKLEKASKNNFSKGFSFKDNLLIYKKCNKQNFVQLTLNPSIDYIRIIKFIKDNSKLKSEKDVNDETEQMKKLLPFIKKLSKCEWGEISKRKTKEYLFIQYINSLSERMNLSSEQKNQLETLILTKVSLKEIANNDIIFDDGKISKISNLVVNQSTNLFEIENKSNKKKCSSIAKSILNESNYLRSDYRMILQKSVNINMLTICKKLDTKQNDNSNEVEVAI